MLDARAAAPDFLGVDVETDRARLLAERDDQRQSDVAQIYRGSNTHVDVFL